MRIFNFSHPNFSCFSLTKDQTKAVFLITIAALLALSPFVLGICRLAKVPKLTAAMSRVSANTLVGLSVTTYIFAGALYGAYRLFGIDQLVHEFLYSDNLLPKNIVNSVSGSSD